MERPTISFGKGVMRSMLALLALGLSASAAWAEGEIVGECSTAADIPSVSCPVDLVEGQDYELRGGGREGQVGLVELVNPATVRFHPDRERETGREFRAAHSTAYRIRVTAVPEVVVSAGVSTDCRADAGTRCSLAPGVGKAGRGSSRSDVDWYRATLRGGRTYTFTCNRGPHTDIVLRDGAGGPLAEARATPARPGVIRHRAAAGGTYYLEASGGRPYTISVR